MASFFSVEEVFGVMDTVYIKKPSICNEANNNGTIRRQMDVVYQLSEAGASNPADWGNECAALGGAKGMPKTSALFDLFAEMMGEAGIDIHLNCSV